ncbi:RRM domain-containing protein [Mycena indigotica]|uniref:RRM domain-containing protein n=1 Tax=Mycena indigotica TaxID=2126181 RepID=A0A8H6SMM2_9AGAR|nr:RRM domain-containing protein [Mycena indigotica]KAF7302119.1 RRM domain-containing protein [Mycena indigotica]
MRAFNALARGRLDFSKLRSISLGGGEDFNMFQNLRDLRSVVLDSIWLDHIQPVIPWAQLTHLTAKGFTFRGFLDIMNMTSTVNLRQISFDLEPRESDLYPWRRSPDTDEEFMDAPEERITRENLTELAVYEGRVKYSHALQHLRAPLLKTLTVGVSSGWGGLEPEPDDEPQDLEHFVPDPDVLEPYMLNDFFRSSGTTHLQKLVLLSAWRHSSWPDHRDDDPFYDLRITELIVGGGVVRKFAEPFLLLLPQPRFLPCLRRLEIRCHERDNDEWQNPYYVNNEDDENRDEVDDDTVLPYEDHDEQDSEDELEDDATGGWPQGEWNFPSVLWSAGHAILRRNAASGRYRDLTRIQIFKLLSDGKNPKMYQVDEERLQHIKRLQASGVVVVAGSEDNKHTVI